jgi:hypothetical protein
MKGVMMLFSGAMAGFRNPRAHGFIEEDPERALEFIAFVSLLAKLIKRCDSGEATARLPAPTTSRTAQFRGLSRDR